MTGQATLLGGLHSIIFVWLEFGWELPKHGPQGGQWSVCGFPEKPREGIFPQKRHVKWSLGTGGTSADPLLMICG